MKAAGIVNGVSGNSGMPYLPAEFGEFSRQLEEPTDSYTTVHVRPGEHLDRSEGSVIVSGSSSSSANNDSDGAFAWAVFIGSLITMFIADACGVLSGVLIINPESNRILEQSDVNYI